MDVSLYIKGYAEPFYFYRHQESLNDKESAEKAFYAWIESSHSCIYKVRGQTHKRMLYTFAAEQKRGIPDIVKTYKLVYVGKEKDDPLFLVIPNTKKPSKKQFDTTLNARLHAYINFIDSHLRRAKILQEDGTTAAVLVEGVLNSLKRDIFQLLPETGEYNKPSRDPTELPGGIGELELDTRAYHTLENHNIQTLWDLSNLFEEDVFSLPGLGYQTFSTIKDKMEERGLKMRKEE